LPWHFLPGTQEWYYWCFAQAFKRSNTFTTILLILFLCIRNIITTQPSRVKPDQQVGEVKNQLLIDKHEHQPPSTSTPVPSPACLCSYSSTCAFILQTASFQCSGHRVAAPAETTRALRRRAGAETGVEGWDSNDPLFILALIRQVQLQRQLCQRWCR
jgi:hypothetical protein